MLLNHINSLQEKTNKLDELKAINESLASKNDYLVKVNKDLETKIKVIQAQEKQLKLVTALTEENSDKQYFKNIFSSRRRHTRF